MLLSAKNTGFYTIIWSSRISIIFRKNM